MPIASLVPLLPFAVTLPSPGLDGTPVVDARQVDDGWDAQVGALGFADREASAGALAVGAVAAATADHDDINAHFHVRGVAATGGSVSLNAGGVSRISATHWAHASYDFLPTADGDGTGVFAMSLEHHLDVGAVPSLFASRDTARAGFEREQLGFDVTGVSFFWQGNRLDILDEGGAFATTWSDETPSEIELGLHATMVRYCGTWCMDVFQIRAQGGGEIAGAAGGVVMDLTPLALRNLHASDDVAIDLAGGFQLGGGARRDDMGALIDLPDLALGAYDVGLRAGKVGVRAHRQMYLTLDDQLSVEDRVEGSIDLSTDDTNIALRGFAARTTWWTDAQDPGSTALTGGGELAIAREDRGFAWDASLGVARSFYASADGAPSLGARGTLEIRRSLRGSGRR